MAVMVKVTGEARRGVSLLRGKAQEVHSSIITSEVATMEDVMADSLFTRRTLAVLMSILALLAIVLTSVGIYGTVSYSVVQRTRELGIRMALGQTRQGAVGLVLRENLVLVLFGQALGFPLALLLVPALNSFRFRFATADLPSTLFSMVLLELVGIAAALLPARAVVRVDPADALRAE
jgi:ABC-type antimicrobial peptide transport system permease subunit